jgi:hypothetical protein
MDTLRFPYDEEVVFQQETSSLRAKCCAGDGPAIAEAVRLCRLYKQPPPKWLEDAVVKLADQSMPDQERRLRRDFANHRERWEAVVEVRERRHELMASKRELRKLDPDADIEDSGETLEKCFAAVAKVLANTDAAGSAETVRASYRLIEAAGGEHATLDSYRLAISQRG